MDITNIQTAVSQVTGITPEQMQIRTRKREIVNARQWTMYFSQAHEDIIADYFGQDRCTVYHAKKTKAILLEVDKQTRAEHDRIYRIMTGEVMDFVI